MKKHQPGLRTSTGYPASRFAKLRTKRVVAKIVPIRAKLTAARCTQCGHTFPINASNFIRKVAGKWACQGCIPSRNARRLAEEYRRQRAEAMGVAQ